MFKSTHCCCNSIIIHKENKENPQKQKRFAPAPVCELLGGLERRDSGCHKGEAAITAPSCSQLQAGRSTPVAQWPSRRQTAAEFEPRVLSSLAQRPDRQMIIDYRQTKILSMYCNCCNIHRPRTITEVHQKTVYYIWSIHLLYTYCCALSQLYIKSNFLIWQCPITTKSIYNQLAIHLSS